MSRAVRHGRTRGDAGGEQGMSFVDRTCPPGTHLLPLPGCFWMYGFHGSATRRDTSEEACRAAWERWAYAVLRGRFRWARTGSGGPMLVSRHVTFFPETAAGVGAEIHFAQLDGEISAADTLEGFVRFAALVLATEGP